MHNQPVYHTIQTTVVLLVIEQYFRNLTVVILEYRFTVLFPPVIEIQT